MSSEPRFSDSETLGNFLDHGQCTIPQYQRELAWDYTKMKKLWQDLFLDCQRLNPKEGDAPYFIGSLITNDGGTSNKIEIVDGQQRLVTLKIISSGIRDALISTGHQDKAWSVHKNLIWDYVNSRTRLEVQNIHAPGKPEQSTRIKIKPYSRLICPVYSGYKLQSDVPAHATRLFIDSSVKAKWTETTEKVHIFRNDKEICTLDLTTATFFERDQRLGPHIDFNPIAEDLDADDEIWISPNTSWSDDTKVQNEYNLGVHEFYEPDFRMLYLLVRSEAEHFIVEQKQYETLSAPLKILAKSVRMQPVNEHHLFKPASQMSPLTVTDSVPTAGDFVSDYDWSEIRPNDTIHSELKIKGSLNPPPATDIQADATATIVSSPKVNPHRSHNNTEQNRAKTLKNLIEDIWLVNIRFKTGDVAGKPISHFIHTNNPEHRADLKTLDLLNALVHRIKDNPYDPAPHRQFTQQTEIATIWKNVWNTLYRDKDKDPTIAQDFFYHWMIASKRWKETGKRWKKSDLYGGLKKGWLDSGSLILGDGNYDLAYLLKEFKEMEQYLELYINAIEPQSITGITAEKHMHKKLLFILNKMGSSQWIPSYLAIRYRGSALGTNVNDTLKVVNGFLKNMVTLYLKYNYYPGFIQTYKSVKSPDRRFIPNQIHGFVDGAGGWIEEIHGKMVRGKLSRTVIDDLSELPRNVVSAKTPVDEWIVGHPSRKYVKGTGQGMKGFLWAYETILSGTGAPTGFEDAHVEHVLPKDPKYWPTKWYDKMTKSRTALHEQCVEKLGNKALIEFHTNGHISNYPFAVKKLPGGPSNPYCAISSCSNHYSTASYASITAAHPRGVRSYLKWDRTDIDKRTEFMMDEIIGFFDF